MSSTTGSEITFTLKACGKINKLTQYNHLRWGSWMIDHFDVARYLDIVLGTKECTPLVKADQNSEAYEKWKGNDAKPCPDRTFRNKILEKTCRTRPNMLWPKP